MPEEYFISQTPDGYSIKRKTRIEENATHWEDVFRHGKTFEDLLKTIDGIPLSLREGAKLNYGRSDVPFPFTPYEKGMIALKFESV
jgi:hypothetical protein